MKTKAFTALITSALIGGFGNTLLASNPQDPWLFLSIRFLTAGLIAIYWIPEFKTLNRKLILASLLEVASVITLVLALSSINVALATIVGALTPILSLLVNKLTHHQPAQPNNLHRHNPHHHIHTIMASRKHTQRMVR